MTSDLEPRTIKYGGGNIERYYKDKWRLRVFIDGKLQTVQSGMTEQQARKVAEALWAVSEERASLKFGHLVELVRKERKADPTLKFGTIEAEQSTWNHIKDALGSIPVAEVTTRDIKDYLKRANAYSTKRNRLVLINKAFEHAIEDELVSVNPAKEIKLKGRKVRLGKAELLSNMLWPDQQIAIARELIAPKRLTLSSVKTLDLRARLCLLSCYLFALGTGCRLSEMWGVRKEDVDIEHGVIVIRRSRGNEAPKSGDWRELPILPATELALRVHAAMSIAFPRVHKSAWLYPSLTTGEQRRDKKQPTGWAKVLQACRLERREWHWLRHMTATSLIAGWWRNAEHEPEPWRTEDVRVLLGHASVTTTEIYANLLDDTAFRAAAKTFHKKQRRESRGFVDFADISLEPLLLECGLQHAPKTFQKLSKPKGSDV